MSWLTGAGVQAGPLEGGRGLGVTEGERRMNNAACKLVQVDGWEIKKKRKKENRMDMFVLFLGEFLRGAAPGFFIAILFEFRLKVAEYLM